MPKTVTIQSRQTLYDIAMQEDGNAEAVFDWAYVNSVSVTETLTPGQVLTKPDSSFTNTDVTQYFKGKGRQIATYSEAIDEVNELEGINYWAIEQDFEVQ